MFAGPLIIHATDFESRKPPQCAELGQSQSQHRHFACCLVNSSRNIIGDEVPLTVGLKHAQIQDV